MSSSTSARTTCGAVRWASTQSALTSTSVRVMTIASLLCARSGTDERSRRDGQPARHAAAGDDACRDARAVEQAGGHGGSPPGGADGPNPAAGSKLAHPLRQVTEEDLSAAGEHPGGPLRRLADVEDGDVPGADGQVLDVAGGVAA